MLVKIFPTISGWILFLNGLPSNHAGIRQSQCPIYHRRIIDISSTVHREKLTLFEAQIASDKARFCSANGCTQIQRTHRGHSEWQKILRISVWVSKENAFNLIFAYTQLIIHEKRQSNDIYVFRGGHGHLNAKRESICTSIQIIIDFWHLCEHDSKSHFGNWLRTLTVGTRRLSGDWNFM